MPATPSKPYVPPRTKRVLRTGPPVDAHDTTDYELSASVALPVHMVPPAATTDEYVPVGRLDSETKQLFQQRLMLCCLVAAVPFFFFFTSAATGFIELFARPVVGWTGIVLSGAVFAALIVTATALRMCRDLPENALRVFEIAIFGAMGLFFAYWQFALLTSDLLRVAGLRDDPNLFRQEQYSVLAAALIVHFNWFALIVFHGVLVPNTLARGIGVVATMAIGALAIDGISAMLHEPTWRHKIMLFAVSFTMLLAGAGLSVFGTAKTAALREEVQTAKQAVRELGQYRLRRKLGQGGMGEVYLAEHRLLKRPCAIKRIHPKYLDNAEQLKRFEREVQATAQLRHPNTVEIYDYGRADDGTFYYVMEYLPGMSLEEIVSAHGPMSADRVVHIIRQVCGALREAHRLGLVHRDIKPSNVVILPDGSPHDQAKVVDFGLVQSLAEEADPNAKITRDGLIVGTPEYMSPEQAQGLPLDECSDLFSLGSVAYFLLTGKEAFHRDNAVRTLLAVVNEEPTPIAVANPYVPSDLAHIVAKCLAKPLASRYTKAADLEAALNACGCANGWTMSRSTEWWDRNPSTHGTGTDLNSLPLA